MFMVFWRRIWRENGYVLRRANMMVLCSPGRENSIALFCKKKKKRKKIVVFVSLLGRKTSTRRSGYTLCIVASSRNMRHIKNHFRTWWKIIFMIQLTITFVFSWKSLPICASVQGKRKKTIELSYTNILYLVFHWKGTHAQYLFPFIFKRICQLHKTCQIHSTSNFRFYSSNNPLPFSIKPPG